MTAQEHLEASWEIAAALRSIGARAPLICRTRTAWWPEISRCHSNAKIWQKTTLPRWRWIGARRQCS